MITFPEIITGKRATGFIIFLAILGIANQVLDLNLILNSINARTKSHQVSNKLHESKNVKAFEEANKEFENTENHNAIKNSNEAGKLSKQDKSTKPEKLTEPHKSTEPENPKESENSKKPEKSSKTEEATETKNSVKPEKSKNLVELENPKNQAELENPKNQAELENPKNQAELEKPNQKENETEPAKKQIEQQLDKAAEQAIPEEPKKQQLEEKPSETHDSSNQKENSPKPKRPEKPAKFKPILLWWTRDHSDRPFYQVAPEKLNKYCDKKCIFTNNRTLVNDSHAVFFHAWEPDFKTKTIEVNGTKVKVPADVPEIRHERQFYIYYTPESSARHLLDTTVFRNFFNWTMTYRLDADFPMPYGQFLEKTKEEIAVYDFDKEMTSRLPTRTNIPVGWLVSNCYSAPSNRTWLTHQLNLHIGVTIYGKCGESKCDLGRKECYEEIAQNHKFYLAFENSLCMDYVTEKFFLAMEVGLVPIVYGKANYGHRFPPGSFINVDSFASAKGLADYLKFLDGDDEEYLKYFRWRKYYKLHNDLDKIERFCAVCERVEREYYSDETSMVDIEQFLLRPNPITQVCTSPPDDF